MISFKKDERSEARDGIRQTAPVGGQAAPDAPPEAPVTESSGPTN